METPLPAPVPPASAAAPPPTGRSVRAGRGVDWWTAAWRLFAAAPGTWIAITIVYVAIMFALLLIPLLGQFGVSLLHPVLAGGIVLGCREQDRGGTLTVGHLFAGFSEKLGPLVILALLYFAGWLVIAFIAIGLVIAVIGGGVLAALASGDPIQTGYMIFSTMSMGALLVLLVCALLALPLLMAFWFAPPLIVLRGDEPVGAMLNSFRACLRNMLPFTVYGVIGLVPVIAVILLLRLPFVAYDSDGLMLVLIAFIPFVLALLVLIPVATATVYTSYKDIFGTAAAPDA